MHKAVIDYLEKLLTIFPENFANVKVLELGSLNVNGTPRLFFSNCEYVGVDWRSGSCVDIVAFAHELDFPSETFDTIITTEMLEHDRYAQKSILNALRMLKRNGIFIFTCANEKRLPHELDAGVGGYYHKISKIELLTWLSAYGDFSKLYIEDVDEDLRGCIQK